MGGDAGDAEYVRCKLKLASFDPLQYPQNALRVSIQESRGLDDEQTQSIVSEIQAVANTSASVKPCRLYWSFLFVVTHPICLFQEEEPCLFSIAEAANAQLASCNNEVHTRECMVLIYRWPEEWGDYGRKEGKWYPSSALDIRA